jgi:hypothetical protein
MEDINSLVERKNTLANERNLVAELYNVLLNKMYDYQKDKEKYDLLRLMMNEMEKYSRMIKQEYREICDEICKIEGVDSIEKTAYFTDECPVIYFARPNEEK